MSLLEQYETAASQPLEEAMCLPFPVYEDEQVFSTELSKIFYSDWVFACASAQIQQPGDYYAFRIGREPVVVLRSKDGSLRALSNTCRHRGTQLLDDGAGKLERHIVCPYHGWAYDDHGALRGAPFSGCISINKQSHNLPQYSVDEALGLIFINLDRTAGGLQGRYDQIAQYVNLFQPERFSEVIGGGEELWQTNWKLAMENAMESYHLFKVHDQTLELYTPTKQSYYIAGSPMWSLTGGAMVDDASTLTKWLRGSTPEVFNHYMLVCLPPSFVGIVSYDSFAWLTVNPTGPTSCEIRAGGIAETANESKSSKDFTEAFFSEDKWICERVQRSMQSSLGKGGKLVEMERIVVDFHQYLAGRLFGTPVNQYFDNTANTVFATGK